MKKNTIVRLAVDVILYIIVFIVLQVLTTSVVMVADKMASGVPPEKISQMIGNGSYIVDSRLMIISSVISSVLTIAIFTWRKWAPVSRKYLSSRPWGVLFWVAIMAFGTIIPSEWLQETMGASMPDSTVKMFKEIMSSPYGYLVIGILAPVAEELVFRGAILRALLGMFSRQMHWAAIIISAVIFGLVHGNSAQFTHAVLLGLLLGWMYYRTGSIIPGLVLHWMNNTIAFVLVNLRPDIADKTITDLCGGDTQRVWAFIGCSLLIFLPALYQVITRIGNNKQIV